MSDKAKRYRWWILGAMGGSLGLVVLDETVVAVALPTIRDDLGLSQVGAHWVINAYLLVFTGLAAAAGKLGDLFDIRGPYLAGLVIFGGGSLACGFSEGGAWMISFRALQGVGAAILFPLSIAIIPKVFEPEDRGLAYGIQTACGGIFLSLGPLAGGFFTELLSWRWIFWINLPVVAANFLVMALLWDQKREVAERKAGFDFAGLASLVLGLGILILAIMQGPSWGWARLQTLACLLAGLTLIVLFVRIETKRTEPLITIALLQDRVLSAANLVIFIGQFCKFAVVVFGALYLQDRLELSPLTAGAWLLAGILPSLPMSLLAGYLDKRVGSRRLILSGLSVSLLAQIVLAAAIVIDSLPLFIAALIVWGTVLPFHYVPPRRVVMNEVAAEQQGQMSGINMTAQLMGGTVSIAVIGALYNMTDDFPSLYGLTAALAALTLVFAWRSLPAED